jgi:hypothetical protein
MDGLGWVMSVACVRYLLTGDGYHVAHALQLEDGGQLIQTRKCSVSRVTVIFHMIHNPILQRRRQRTHLTIGAVRTDAEEHLNGVAATGH